MNRLDLKQLVPGAINRTASGSAVHLPVALRLPQKTPKQLAKEAAAAKAAGEPEKPPSLSEQLDEWYKYQPYGMQLFCNFLLAVLVLGVVTATGGFVFGALEKHQGDMELGNYFTFMATVENQMTNATAASNTVMGAALYQQLIGNGPNTQAYSLQYTLPAPYSSNGTPLPNGWSISNFQAFLFSFELLSTIGYGEIAPRTAGGRLWLCLFSLLTIPMAGICLSTIATCALDMLDVLYISCTLQSHRHWHEARGEDGVATPASVRAALDAISDEDPISDEDWESQMSEAKVVALPDGSVNYLQFVRLYLTCKNEANERKMMRFYSSTFLVVLWLIMGMLVFNKLEQWGYVASFYFCFVTLTTIGLGDYYPATPQGLAFHFFFCVTGLGLVAVMLNSIAGLTDGDEEEEEEEEVEPPPELTDRERAAIIAQQVLVEAMTGVAAPQDEDGNPAVDELSPPSEAQQASRRVVSASITALSQADKQRILRQILAESRTQTWLYDTLLPYVPMRPAEGGAGSTALPGGARAAPPVVKVFGPVAPRRVAAGQAVPGFKPSYTQLYADEPYNLSGAGREGNIAYGAEGRTGFDRSGVSHGPFEPASGLAAAAMGALSLQAPPRGEGGVGDDNRPWGPASRKGGSRPPGVPPYDEGRPANRL